MIAPDETTFAYLEGRPHAPTGRRLGRRGRRTGATLRTDDDAVFDDEVVLDADDARRRSSPGAPTPARACRSAAPCPTPTTSPTPTTASAAERALEYMGLDGRHADARHRGRHRLHRLVHQRPHRGPARRRRRSSRAAQVADGVRMLVVPGSARVRLQAEAEGLDEVFTEAGAEWRGAGCSMCLGMNPDQLAPGRAQRVDLQPQLRGPPGQGRAHPPGLAAGRRRHRRRAARSSRPADLEPDRGGA